MLFRSDTVLFEKNASNCVSVSRRKSFASMLADSAINSALAAITALVITPMAIGVIGPSIYGAWLASGDLMIWLQSSDLGLCNLMIQRLGSAHGKDDANAVARNFGTCMVLIFGISLLVGVVGVALSFALPCIDRKSTRLNSS